MDQRGVAPLRLASRFWLVAQASYLIGNALHRFSMHRLIGRDEFSWITLAWGLKPAVFMVAYLDASAIQFWPTAPFLEQITTGLTMQAAACWVLSCWLMSEPRDVAGKTRLWVRVLGIVTPAAGIVTYIVFRVTYNLAVVDALQVLDPILVLAVALHLRTIAQATEPPALSATAALAEKAAYVVGAWLLVIALQWGRNPVSLQAADALEIAQTVAGGLCGIVMAIVMARLGPALLSGATASAPSPPLTPAPAENPPP